MQCPSCGARCSVDDTQCERCGENLVQCPRCSALMAAEDRVCRACGADREASVSTAEVRLPPVIEAAGQELPDLVPVKGGKQKKVIVAYGESLTVSVPKNREDDLVVEDEITQPVKAPLTWPNSSLSIRFDGRAAQLTLTKAVLARWLL